MSEVIAGAVEALENKLSGAGFDASVKFVINGEGAVIVDEAGVRAGDDEAQCTLCADADTFTAIMDGSLNATAAFMTGKLT
ncbi:MAG: SCP2 sterol-binding domain-containing protein, partial [Paracoccaceae bacterium]